MALNNDLSERAKAKKEVLNKLSDKSYGDKEKQVKTKSLYKKISISLPSRLYEELKVEADRNFELGLSSSTISEIIRDALAIRKAAKKGSDT